MVVRAAVTDRQRCEVKEGGVFGIHHGTDAGASHPSWLVVSRKRNIGLIVRSFPQSENNWTSSCSLTADIALTLPSPSCPVRCPCLWVTLLRFDKRDRDGERVNRKCARLPLTLRCRMLGLVVDLLVDGVACGSRDRSCLPVFGYCERVGCSRGAMICSRVSGHRSQSRRKLRRP